MKRSLISFVLVVLFVSFPVFGGINDGLVSHWTFDETSGTTAADSAGSNTGTVYGSPQWTAGKIGGALYFDGINDYVDSGDNSSLDLQDNLTFSMWFNSTAWTTRTGGVYVNGFISKRDVYKSGQGWEFCYNNFMDDIQLWDNHITSFNNLSIKPSTNEWHQVVVAKSGTTLALYLDGVFKGTDTTSALWISTGDSLRIGVGAIDWIPDPGFFYGAIDDVRIYNRVLSTDEVAQLYVVPEPATLLLLGLGGLFLRKRK